MTRRVGRRGAASRRRPERPLGRPRRRIVGVVEPGAAPLRPVRGFIPSVARCRRFLAGADDRPREFGNAALVMASPTKRTWNKRDARDAKALKRRNKALRLKNLKARKAKTAK